MAQTRLGDIFAHIHDKPVNGRTEGQRIERHERLGGVLAALKDYRRVCQLEILELRKLEAKIKRELEALE